MPQLCNVWLEQLVTTSLSPNRKCLSASYTPLYKTPLMVGFWGTPEQGCSVEPLMGYPPTRQTSCETVFWKIPSWETIPHLRPFYAAFWKVSQVGFHYTSGFINKSATLIRQNMVLEWVYETSEHDFPPFLPGLHPQDQNLLFTAKSNPHERHLEKIFSGQVIDGSTGHWYRLTATRGHLVQTCSTSLTVNYHRQNSQNRNILCSSYISVYFRSDRCDLSTAYSSLHLLYELFIIRLSQSVSWFWLLWIQLRWHLVV